jgi:UDP-N-acetylglucosamine--N-acetylmuramyl-(pentapeptide) pyrophosphoryl-undecaprenol N-acetylglucosamine transferase
MAPPGSLRGVILLALATLRSLLVLLRCRPSVTFATGGYTSAPAALASCLRRVPVVLYLPDVVPGKAVRWLAGFARGVAVSSEASLAYLPKEKTVVTGYPVREEFLETSRAAGRARFGLPADATVLCVFGGSQGSRSINEALAACLPELLSRYHVLHICGQARLPEAEAAATRLAGEQRGRYLLVAYLHDRDMADALAAADLALCRSGASTLGELPAVGTPAVLVPLPARRVHQEENARYLADRGAAVILPDGALSRLGPTLHALLADREGLQAMADSCRALARPQAAAEVADLILRSAA